MWKYVEPVRSDELRHHGVKGMRWYDRRYQYPNGALTPEGYIHYGYGKNYNARKLAGEAIASGKVPEELYSHDYVYEYSDEIINLGEQIEELIKARQKSNKFKQMSEDADGFLPKQYGKLLSKIYNVRVKSLTEDVDFLTEHFDTLGKPDDSDSNTSGMHWGERKYQNEDGTLTEAGKKKSRCVRRCKR